jgi:hypothetical protein
VNTLSVGIPSDDPPPRGAERRADADLPAPERGTCEQQARHVRACDEQDQEDRTEHRGEELPRPAANVALGVRYHPRLHVGRAARVRGLDALRERVKLRLRGARRHAWLEAAVHLEQRAFAARKTRRVQIQRDPDVLRGGKPESLRHHADDFRGAAVHADLSAQHARVRAIAVLPGGMPEDDHRRGARRVVAGAKASTQQRLHPENAERVGRHEAAAEPLRMAGVTDVDGACMKSGQFLEDTLLFAPVQEVMKRHAHLYDPLRGVAAVDVIDPVRALKGQSAQQHAVDDAVHHGGQPDPHAKREDGHQREPRIPAQQAEAETQVVHERAHKRASLFMSSIPEGRRMRQFEVSVSACAEQRDCPQAWIGGYERRGEGKNFRLSFHDLAVDTCTVGILPVSPLPSVIT